MRCFFKISLVVTALVYFSSCKDPEELGLDVLPPSDQVHVFNTDTETLVTKTVKEDSLASNGVSFQLLGGINEQVFGKSDASFYTQVRLGLTPNLAPDGGDLVPDSLILSMVYAGYYGDTNTTQNVHVYRIDEDIISDSAYYTNKVFSLYSPVEDLAGSFKFKPHPLTVVNVGGITLLPQLRIKLSNSLAAAILGQVGQAPLTDNNGWLQYFKGLYLKTDPMSNIGTGVVSYFDLNSPFSTMTLYYHNITHNQNGLSYTFALSSAQSISHQEHDYNFSSDVGHQLQDSSFNDTLNYIQGMAGVKTKITLPYLNELKSSGNIALNKAELEITIANGTTSVYNPPPKLFLVYTDDAGNSYFLTDYFEGSTYFGGIYNPTGQTYTFNIVRHLQKILNGELANKGLYLLVSGAVIQANRVVVTSSKHPVYPMKLHLYYTKLH